MGRDRLAVRGKVPSPPVGDDVPELISGTRDLLVWTWGTSGLWDARLKLHSRARLIAGNATKPFSPQLIAGAMISLLPS